PDPAARRPRDRRAAARVRRGRAPPPARAEPGHPPRSRPREQGASPADGALGRRDAARRHRARPRRRAAAPLRRRADREPRQQDGRGHHEALRRPEPPGDDDRAGDARSRCGGLRAADDPHARRPHRERLEAAARGGGAGGLGGRPSNHGGCGERSGGCERRARSSLLRRPTPGPRPARRTSSVVAALAALAPRLVRLAHHDYPDALLAIAAIRTLVVDHQTLAPHRLVGSPTGPARVEEAGGRVRARLGAANAAPDWERVLRRVEEQRKVYVSQVPVHSGKRILILPATDVLWFGVEYRLVYAHTAERAFMTNYTLRELEERLDPAHFFRAHKSSLVNLG